MPITAERHAPASPDHRPSDDELHAIVYGDHPDSLLDGSAHEPDEIEYKSPVGTLRSYRSERHIAATALRERAPMPNNAAESLAHTEAMLRFRIKHMGEEERAAVVHDAVAFHSDSLPKIQLDRSPIEEPEDESWKSDATGNFAIPAESRPDEPAQSEYTGRHRSRRMRIPLHRFIRHRGKYTSRHAA